MHILGMAKSSLSLKGAKASKLELDFFKLAFAVAALRTTGEQAFGYLQVLAQPVRDRATGWTRKYATADAVTIVYAAPAEADLVALIAEKARNALGLLTTADAEQAEEALSLASFGEALGEAMLVREIMQRHPTAVRVTERQRYPQNIDWDYYGTITLPEKT